MERNEFINELKEIFLMQLNSFSEFKEDKFPFFIYYIAGDLVISERAEGVRYSHPELITTITVNIESFTYNNFIYEIMVNNLKLKPIDLPKRPANLLYVTWYNLFVIFSNTFLAFQNKQKSITN